VALAAIAAAIALVATRRSARAISIAPNSVAVIASRGNRVVGAIRVGNSPTKVVVRPNAVWVLNSREQTISRIDPVTRNVVRSFASPPGTVDLTFGAGSLWITTSDNRLARVDPLVNQVAQTSVLSRSSAEGSWVASDNNDVWASAPHEVVRVAPVPPRTVHVRNFPCCSAIAIGAGALWATDPQGLERVDPGTGETTHIALPFFSKVLAVGDGAVWVPDEEADTVWQIDSHTNQVIRTIPVGGHPTGVAVDADGVWVTTANGRLVELDASGSRIRRSLPLGGTPSAVAVGAGFIWVTID
jgi:YVTN family beta-propeller protein